MLNPTDNQAKQTPMASDKLYEDFDPTKTDIEYMMIHTDESSVDQVKIV